MTETQIETTLAAVFFAVLLAIEWRYRLRSVRVATAVLALLALLLSQPSMTNSRRRAMSLPRAERVTEFWGDPLSEYHSGVLTLAEVYSENSEEGFGGRVLGLGVLLWLACSPALRRAPGTAKSAVHPGAPDPDAA